MTIDSQIRKSPTYVGTGTTDTFAFGFKIFEEDELKVIKLNHSTQVETVLIYNTNYYVSLNEDQLESPGGTITLQPEPLEDQNKLVIISNVDYLQQIKLTNQGGFYPEVLNDGFDKATIQIQQLLEEVDRCLKLSELSSTDSKTILDDLSKILEHIGKIILVADNIIKIIAVSNQLTDIGIVADNISNIESFALVYQGAKAVAPTVRNSGDSLQSGDLYFNTTTNRLNVYDGNSWLEISVSQNVSKQYFWYNVAGPDDKTFSNVDEYGKTLQYTVGFLEVFLQGKVLEKSKYTATNGTSVTLDSNVTVAAGNEVHITSVGTFLVANIGPDQIYGKLATSTNYVDLPNGTTIQRPANPAAGFFRYNSSLSLLEYYNGSTWVSITSSSSSGSFLILSSKGSIYNPAASRIYLTTTKETGSMVAKFYTMTSSTVIATITDNIVKSVITLSIPSAVYSKAVDTYIKIIITSGTETANTCYFKIKNLCVGGTRTNLTQIAFTVLHKYTTITTDTDQEVFTVPADWDIPIEYFVLAGGGGGGGAPGNNQTLAYNSLGGGGGGGGGIVKGIALVKENTSYKINVGAGGRGGRFTPIAATQGLARNGECSGIEGISNSFAEGGGAGASSTISDSTAGSKLRGLQGNTGGSGGGSSPNYTYAYTTSGEPGLSYAGQGKKGGGGCIILHTSPPQKNFCWAGGGGGAGGNGETVSADITRVTGAKGGNGLSDNFSGTATIYAGGGAGTGNYVTTAGTGGTGGGGNGGVWNSSSTVGEAGEPNEGGGGGASGRDNISGGAGGSGLVLIKYYLG